MKTIKKNIKAILFDMDGTIINSEHIWHKATMSMLEAHGISELTEEQRKVINSFSGIGLNECIARLKVAFNLEETHEELIIEKKAIFANLLDQHMPEFIEGFKDFHSLLNEHEITCCIATNADEHSLKKLSRQLEFAKYFGKNVFGISLVDYKAKPDPAIFLHAAEQLGVKPEECLVFEDSLFGFLAAKAAGMKCIAIKSETNKDKLHHVHESIDNYNQAVEAIKKVVNKK